MKDKQNQTKKHVSKRAAERQRARQRRRLWTIGLAILALAGLAGLAVWSSGREKAPAAAATIDPGRSKGSETATVLVEEYGDFQ